MVNTKTVAISEAVWELAKRAALDERASVREVVESAIRVRVARPAGAVTEQVRDFIGTLKSGVVHRAESHWMKDDDPA